MSGIIETTNIQTENIKHTNGTTAATVGSSGELTVSGAFTSQGIDDNANATAITIDSNENIGIGGAPNNFGGMTKSVEIKGTSDVELSLHATSDSMSDGARIGQIVFNAGSDSTVPTVTAIRGIVAGTSENKGKLSFHTRNDDTGGTPAERMRIDNGGRLLLGATDNIAAAGNARFQLSQSNNNWISYIENSASSGNVYCSTIRYTGQSPDNNTSAFMECVDSGPTARFVIYSDGDVKNHDNSYGAISDEKLKEQITDASSQWEDIKALKVRKYKMKEDVAVKGDSDEHWRLGVVAQELETAGMNGLVKDDPDLVENEDGQRVVGDTTTKSVKYSILYMKAVKALQEAMTRIETLEAKVTALENAE